ncbi:MAG: sugar ABC transporter permease [Lachnospiraceae bacterium]|nr:sugar ABC transporter permease [Lachnospiraceae bacterium]
MLLKTKRKIRQNLTWYSFLAVSIIAIILFVYIPMFSTIRFSLYDVQVVGYGGSFVGLKNYRVVLTQRVFLRALGNTLILAVMGLLTIPIGFILAVMINSLGRGKLQTLFRVGFYMPNIIAGVSVVLIFQVVLRGEGGLLNNVLSALLGHKIAIGWLSDMKYSKLGATIIYIFQNEGFAMLINLASLQAIPSELYDSASVDGATAWNKLVYITMPAMKKCFSFLLVTQMISSLARFTDLYIIGGNSATGFPGGSLQTIMMYIYQFSFESPQYGISSAGSMILFILVFAFTILNVKLTGFFNEEE